MRIRSGVSLVVPTVVLLIVVVTGLTVAHYFMAVRTLKSSIGEKESNTSELVNFIAGSLMEREINKLRYISTMIGSHQGMLDGMIHYRDHGKDDEPLKRAVERMFLELDLDLLIITDKNRNILFRAFDAQKNDLSFDLSGTGEALAGRKILLTSEISAGCVIRAVTPALKGQELLGAVAVGMLIDDNYARRLAYATDVEVAFGSMNGIIASSLPPEQRDLIDTRFINRSIRELKQIRQPEPRLRKVLHYGPLELPEADISLILQIDTTLSDRLLQQNARDVIRFSIITVVVAISLGIAAAYRLVRPLKRITVKAQRTVREISGKTFVLGKGNEIHMLDNAFDAMVQTALNHIAERREAESELKKHKEQLELLVDERTSELRQTNSRLEQTIHKLELRTNEILLLNRMSELLQECADERETYAVAAHCCERLFPGYSGAMSLYQKETGMLNVVVSWGVLRRGDIPDDRLECIQLHDGRLVRKQFAEKHLSCGCDQDRNDCGCLCVPMHAQGEFLGVFHLRTGSTTGEDAEPDAGQFRTASRMLLISLVEHYAPALANIRLREMLREQSIHDPLTGLFNRRYMEESLKREVHRAERTGSPLGIIMIDVDHFKAFNDNYGHKIGDMILQRLGEFFQKRIRREDIACRYGGEEFLLILPQSNLESTRMRAEEMCHAIQNDIAVEDNGRQLRVTVSLGVAAFPEHGPLIEDTLQLADAALFQAKAQGRNRVVTAT